MCDVWSRCVWGPSDGLWWQLIATGFNMEHGGKVPKMIIGKCDEWLRQSARLEQRALIALSAPRDRELEKIARMRK